MTSNHAPGVGEGGNFCTYLVFALLAPFCEEVKSSSNEPQPPQSLACFNQPTEIFLHSSHKAQRPTISKGLSSNKCFAMLRQSLLPGILALLVAHTLMSIVMGTPAVAFTAAGFASDTSNNTLLPWPSYLPGWGMLTVSCNFLAEEYETGLSNQPGALDSLPQIFTISRQGNPTCDNPYDFPRTRAVYGTLCLPEGEWSRTLWARLWRSWKLEEDTAVAVASVSWAALVSFDASPCGIRVANQVAKQLPYFCGPFVVHSIHLSNS